MAKCAGVELEMTEGSEIELKVWLERKRGGVEGRVLEEMQRLLPSRVVMIFEEKVIRVMTLEEGKTFWLDWWEKEGE